MNKYKAIYRAHIRTPENLILAMGPRYKGSDITYINVIGVNNKLVLSDAEKDAIDNCLKEILKIIRR